jgi:hypothetical protein
MKLYADTSWWLGYKFHVAIAIEVGAEAMLSFDTEQIALADAAGLTVLTLKPTSS